MNNIILIIFINIFISCGSSESTNSALNTPTRLPDLACQSSTPLTDGDPLSGCAWHLNNIGDKGFSAAGGTNTLNSEFIDMNMLSSGIAYKGSGIKIAISDSGLELVHEDLEDNILTGASRNYSLAAPYLGDPGIAGLAGDHGTSVAGIIAARDSNDKGSRGIASRSLIAGFNFLNSIQNIAMKIDQSNGAFDIFNQSWGLTPIAGNDIIEAAYESQLKFGTSSLRAGKGAIYVKAAGNAFSDGVNSNMDPFNTTPYTFVIGAITASGRSASYSQAGSCNLLVAPGGEFGINEPAIITTDVSSCDSGYARTQISLFNKFEEGNQYNQDCSYTSTFNGTSSATPMTTGTIALMLEANPALTWRDVRHILITTAKKIDSALTDITNNLVSSLPAVPAGHVWETGWTDNAAGYPFHNWYGFGTIDVDAAVSAASSYSTDLQVYNESVLAGGDWAYKSGAISLAIPDGSATGVTSVLNVAQVGFTVESVQIKVNITHAFSGDIGLELTSPSGTKSIMLNVNNYFKDNNDLINMVLLSNMFYGEPATGNWTLKVIDGSATDTGTLTRWDLKINGRAASLLTF